MVEKKCAETTELLRNIRNMDVDTRFGGLKPLNPKKMYKHSKASNNSWHRFGMFSQSSLLSLCWAPKSCYQLENMAHNTRIGIFIIS
jgi:hypothetical protein